MVSRCDKGGLAGRYFNFSTTIDLAGICTVSLLPLSFAQTVLLIEVALDGAGLLIPPGAPLVHHERSG